jgi:hypothetical protein
MCDVTRFAYQDLGELQAELDARLGGAGLTRDDYDAFKAELASNEARRAEVVAAYDGLCGD